MKLVAALTPTEQCALVLLFTGILAPLIGMLFRRVSGGWDQIGKGPLAIDQDVTTPRYLRSPEAAVDPAIQAAEVRQMLQARSERRQRQGHSPLDVEAEAERLLASADPSSPLQNKDAELRREVRQLVVARNERRMRKGLSPLDVEAEIERQLEDFVGSP